MKKNKNIESSIDFFYDFVLAHPRLTSEQEYKLIYKFRFIYDLIEQLEIEKEKLIKEISESKPGLAHLVLHRELKEVNDILKDASFTKKATAYRNKLINHNLRLIIKTASYYKGKGLEFDDLIQEGSLGFIRAIEKFDPNKEVNLGTYALWWIRQKITRALSNKTRMIRLPVHITSKVTKVLGYIRRHDLDVDDRYIAEIAAGLDIPEEDVQAVFGHVMSFYPVNYVVSEEAENDQYSVDSFEDTSTCIDTDIDLQTFHSNFKVLVSNLTPYSRLILTLRHGWHFDEGLPYAKITAYLKKNLDIDKDNIKREIDSSIEEVIKTMTS